MYSSRHPFSSTRLWHRALHPEPTPNRASPTPNPPGSPSPNTKRAAEEEFEGSGTASQGLELEAGVGGSGLLMRAGGGRAWALAADVEGAASPWAEVVAFLQEVELMLLEWMGGPSWRTGAGRGVKGFLWRTSWDCSARGDVESSSTGEPGCSSASEDVLRTTRFGAAPRSLWARGTFHIKYHGFPLIKNEN